MKAKVRILAMLLTALMVVGMLPLALFAAGETLSDPVSGAVTGNDSWETVNSTLKANGLDAYIYQNFENIPDSDFTDGVIDLPGIHCGDWAQSHHMAAYKVNFSAGNFYPMEIKNQMDAFSIRKESDGNKALYLGVGTDPGSNNDNWFDLEGANLGQGNDILISADFKMGGAIVAECNGFITFITRQVTKPDGSIHSTGRQDTQVVGLTRDGGLFLWDGGKATPIVGRLSQTEYTNVTIETDLMNNKYYCYINGVLVNPNGYQFMSDSMINKFKTDANANFNPSLYKLAEVRLYTVSGANGSEDWYKGMYYDNLLLAGRTMLKAGNSKSLNIYTMDLSGVPERSIGSSVSTYESGKFPGTLASGASTSMGTKNGTDVAKNSVVYYKEANGDLSIKFTKTTSTENGDQYYPNLHVGGKTKANAGQNMILKGKYRAGSDSIRGFDIFAVIDRTIGKRADVLSVSIGGDRILRVEGEKTSTVANIPTDRFVEIEAQLICNAANGRLLVKVYIDGNIAYSREIRENRTNHANTWVGKTVDGLVLTAQTPIIQDIHLAGTYDNAFTKFADDDIHMKDISVAYTNAFNAATSAKFNPFAVKSTGFVTAGYVTRYLENGTPKTEDFVLNGETYKVSEAGGIIGKLSDGVHQTPYAPYVDWNHTGSFIVNAPEGSGFTGGSGTMATGRYAQVLDGINTSFGKASYYISFTSFTQAEKDAEAQGTRLPDRNSYYDISLGDRKKDSSVVLDFDIMLGDYLGDFTLFMTRAKKADGSGQSDCYALRIQKGWLTNLVGNTDVKIAKLSQSEFNRISIVVKTVPSAGGNATYTVYFNGVVIVPETVFYTGAEGAYVDILRMFQSSNEGKIKNLYVKDYFLYEGAKPQQFYTMENGIAVLTSDQTKTPAKAADLKQGFVEEDGVIRYYNELGLPVLGQEFEVGGKTYTAGANGNLVCNGETHLETNKGNCAGCGVVLDGMSTLYGNSLVLGSDVKVVFYLDLDAEALEGGKVVIGLDRAKSEIPVADLETVTIGGQTLYKVAYAVSGKDVCADVSVKAVKADGTEGTVYTYSAAQYAEDVQKKATDGVYTAELKALAKALTVYGKTAAAVLADGASYEVTDEVSFNDVADAEGAKDSSIMPAVKLNKFSLELKSNIKFKLYFTVDEEAIMMNGYSIEDYLFTVDGENAEYTVNDGIYCIEKEIVAADLGKTIVFRIYNSVDEFGLTLNVSPLYYAKVVVSSDNTDADYKNLAKALKLYADAAAAYADASNEDSRPTL